MREMHVLVHYSAYLPMLQNLYYVFSTELARLMMRIYLARDEKECYLESKNKRKRSKQAMLLKMQSNAKSVVHLIKCKSLMRAKYLVQH